MQAAQDGSVSPTSAPAYAGSRLTVQVGNQTYIADAAGAPIVIGREAPAQLRIEDDRISRIHVRLDCTPNGWVAVDQSRNGIFVDGARQSSIPIREGTTIYLGNPQGIRVTFSFGAPAPQIEPEPQTLAHHDDSEFTIDTIDPGVARAGAAVAARREELKVSQRYLAKEGIVAAGTLISFEKGRKWPRRATLAKLEDALQWPHGTIARIRRERVTSGEERTEVFTHTMPVPGMAEAVEVALDGITAAIEALPGPSERDFTGRVSRILADLRRLEGVAAGAARTAKGDHEVALLLSDVRRTYKDVMLRAARAPGATLGQRLYAARYRAELSAEETANAAGVPIEMITAAEAEVPLDANTMAAVQAVLASLTRR
jgi:DNA-binding transcriptional regulator YiaG